MLLYCAFWADSTETRLAYYVFGPMYVDEVIVMYNDRSGEDQDYYYAHDILYSPVALLDKDGAVVEFYEYDAYGKCQFLDSSHTALGTQASGKNNPHLFTGRRLDLLDSGDLDIMYYRARYYDTETGRFISRDPLGIMPHGGEKNPFNPRKQYVDGMNLYQYVKSNPIVGLDPLGMVCGSGWTDKYIPDKYKYCDFTQACQNHDDCYGKGGGCSAKNSCDRNFYDDMTDAVISGGAQGWCSQAVNIYYNVVKQHGHSAFNNAGGNCCPSSGGGGGGSSSGIPLIIISLTLVMLTVVERKRSRQTN